MQSELRTNELRRMLTVNEVAHVLHIHPTTVRRWEKKGLLKSYRLGARGSIRFKREDISNFIDSAKKPQDRGGHSDLVNGSPQGRNQ